jgi:hypothetical protein
VRLTITVCTGTLYCISSIISLGTTQPYRGGQTQWSETLTEMAPGLGREFDIIGPFHAKRRS